MNCTFNEEIIADGIVVDCAAYCFFCHLAVDDSTKLNDNDYYEPDDCELLKKLF
jgi:hypothetical protein